MNPYPGGQCTWGAAEMCQCLQNIAQYGNFGNGGDWFAHAQSIGLETSNTPNVGWLVSLSTLGWPDGPGDVGLVIGVKPNGDIIRYGVNWHQDGKWSTDTVSAHMVIGSFKPPCACIGPAGAQLFSANSSSPQGTAPCMTFRWQWSLLGQNIDLCFDPIVGMVSVVGGIAIMAVGAFVLMIATGNRIKVDKQEKQDTQPAQTQETQQTQQTQQLLPSGLTQQQQQQIVQQARERARQRKLMQPRTAPVQGSRAATAVPRVPVP